MSKVSYVFERREKKYLLTETQAKRLLQYFSGELQSDEYGEYTVCNVYLDTPQYDLIRRSLQKPVYKEKLRLRSYGVPTKDATVFLELKKKYKHVVYKRRIKLSAEEAKRYICDGVPPSKDTQIFRELDWAVRRYEATPKLYLAYDRRAFFGVEDATLRITFDRNIRFRTDRLSLTEGDEGERLLADGQVLMEIKCAGAMPLWLGKVLSEMQAFPTSFSKYGRCFEELCKRGDIDVCDGIAVARSTLDPDETLE